MWLFGSATVCLYTRYIVYYILLYRLRNLQMYIVIVHLTLHLALNINFTNLFSF